ncbi:MAG: hypothetical protein J1E41_07900 [Ruminococcus sp.]|nr:hypothetical protein [Ruminococcus sp.]
MAFTSDSDDKELISRVDKELISRVEDLADLSFTRNRPSFLGFLNEREQYIINQHFSFYSSEIYFFGGYENAKRKFLCFSQYEIETKDYPISEIYFKFRNVDKLSHRDFLGALMNLGIERNCIGDIVVNEGAAVCFVKNEIKDYIQSQISKIGRVGVRISDKSDCKIDFKDDIETLTFIVSSMRLDVVVAAITNLSREKTANLLLSGKVFTNYFENKNVSYILKPDDILSIRGYGKFAICEFIGNNKKGKLIVGVKKYK